MLQKVGSQCELWVIVTPVTQKQMETPHKKALVWCVSPYRITLNISPLCCITALFRALPSPFPE